MPAGLPAIDRAGYEDAPQPFATHPNLELYLSTASPHPINDYGCTGCHAGRGRGYYDSAAESAIKTLISDIQELLVSQE